MKIIFNICCFFYLLLGINISTFAFEITPNHCEGKEISSLGVSLNNITSKTLLKTFVQEILELDMETRQSILDFKYPEELQNEEHLIRLKSMVSLVLVNKADCFLAFYEKGDVLFKYEIDDGRGSEKGYVLIRNKRIYAHFILELMLI